MTNIEQTTPQGVSLATLSSQARQLLALLATDPNFLEEMLKLFSQDKDTLWTLAQQKVGWLSEQDRRVLELLAELFVPDSSLALVVTNECGKAGCWM